MNAHPKHLLVLQVAPPGLPAAIDRAHPATQRRLFSQLAARAFEAASPAERSRLLEALIRPLGLLSLAAVANGLFATWHLRSRGGDLHVPPDEAGRVSPGELSALVEHLQQVGAETLDGLVGVLSASPLVTSSSAAALLLVLLVRRARQRPRPAPGSDFEP